MLRASGKTEKPWAPLGRNGRRPDAKTTQGLIVGGVASQKESAAIRDQGPIRHWADVVLVTKGKPSKMKHTGKEAWERTHTYTITFLRQYWEPRRGQTNTLSNYAPKRCKVMKNCNVTTSRGPTNCLNMTQSALNTRLQFQSQTKAFPEKHRPISIT